MGKIWEAIRGIDPLVGAILGVAGGLVVYHYVISPFLNKNFPGKSNASGDGKEFVKDTVGADGSKTISGRETTYGAGATKTVQLNPSEQLEKIITTIKKQTK